MHALPDDESTLSRLELMGSIARACRIALSEVEEADSVEFTIKAGPEGLTVDCTLTCGDVPLMGWGQ